MVVLEIVEEFLERRVRGQFRHRALAIAWGRRILGFDGLRGRDVDHRIDHLLGDIGDRFRTARGCRLRRRKACEPEADRHQQGTQAPRERQARSCFSA